MRALREQVDLLRDGMRRRGAVDALAPAHRPRREPRSRASHAHPGRRGAEGRAQRQRRRKSRGARRPSEPADELIARGRALGDEIARLEGELAAVEESLRTILLELPNVTLAEVPAGGEERNVIVRDWGSPRDPAGVKPHWEIGAALGIIDLERAAKVSGSGFVVLPRRRRAPRSCAHELLHRRARARARLRGGVAAGARQSRDDDRHGAAPEVRGRRVRTCGRRSLSHPDGRSAGHESLSRRDPRAETRCRWHSSRTRHASGARRASAGKDTRGILRTHEFDKVELVRYATPEDVGRAARAPHASRRDDARAARHSVSCGSCSPPATRDSARR